MAREGSNLGYLASVATLQVACRAARIQVHKSIHEAALGFLTQAAAVPREHVRDALDVAAVVVHVGLELTTAVRQADALVVIVVPRLAIAAGVAAEHASSVAAVLAIGDRAHRSGGRSRCGWADGKRRDGDHALAITVVGLLAGRGLEQATLLARGLGVEVRVQGTLGVARALGAALLRSIIHELREVEAVVVDLLELLTTQWLR